MNHMKDCQYGDNWLDCPACVEGYNETCGPDETVVIPTQVLPDEG